MSVSDAAQQVGMSENDLRSLNSIPPRMLIKAGSALMVPRTTTTRQDVSKRVSRQKRPTLLLAHQSTVCFSLLDSLQRRFHIQVEVLEGGSQCFIERRALTAVLPKRCRSSSIGSVIRTKWSQTA